MVARAQEDLRRAERARGKDQRVGGDARLTGFARPGALRAIVHVPAALPALGDTPHERVREDLRAVSRRVRQISHGNGVLCPDVAPAAAIATTRAGRLRYAGRIDRVFEADDDRRLDRLAA